MPRPILAQMHRRCAPGLPRPLTPPSPLTPPQVHAGGKGKQRMRSGGGAARNQQMMAQTSIPTPPVDPDNVEFVIFVRSKKLPQWVPLSIVKGGAAANLLVKGLESNVMEATTRKTLTENVGRAVYKDRVEVEKAVRQQFPMFKAAKEFEYGFKIRDREEPKAWYLSAGVMLIPEEAELGVAPLEGVNEALGGAVAEAGDKVATFFDGLGKSLGLQGQ